MARRLVEEPKVRALRDSGTLNGRSEEVRDELFHPGAFFDPRDLVQVKYEMLRRVDAEGASVTEAASAFGLSRVAFYEARRRMEGEGLAGLLSRPRGPKRAHKLSEEVMAFLDGALAEDGSLRAPALAERVRERFGLSVHPRSIERALARRRKRGRP
jgi:transposase